MANVRSILLKLTGDGTEARRELKRVADDVKDLGRQAAEVRVTAKTEGVIVQLDRAKERLDRLSKQEATPQVKIQTARTIEQIDRLEAKLNKLGRKDVNVDVDVGRGIAERGVSGLATALGAVPDVARTAAQGLLGMVSALTALGPLSAAAVGAIALLLPFIVLLGTSLLSAAAGVGVLAVALAGALGPAVLVGIAALARFAQILLAIKERNTQASGQAKAVADAQDQVTAATDNLATAQQNLKAQTTAAWQAYHDAIETVKDDLLSVQQAELGIDQANLNLRKAKEELKDFKGAGEDAVAGIVRKFSDVNVDFDLSAIRKAFDGAGVGGDDQLKLEQLILNVRSAALSEKQATDTLSDAKRKLNRDRRTEADFLQRGIRAYEGYRSALRGVEQAERSLLAVQRQQSRALEQQNRLWKDLSPAEQRFARQLERFADAIRKAFGPSTRSILRGFGRLLESATDALRNPAVVAGIAVVGQSIGRVFRDWARELRRPEFRRAFREFSEGAARLIRQLGSNAARSFFRLLLRIGTEALPVLERGAKSAARWIERLVNKLSQPATNTKTLLGQPLLTEKIPKTPIERFVDNSIRSFRKWLNIIKELGGVLKVFLRAAGGEGDKFADSLLTVLRRFNRILNSDDGQTKLKDFFRRIRELADKVAKIIDHIYSTISKIAKTVNSPGGVKLPGILGKTGVGQGFKLGSQIAGGHGKDALLDLLDPRHLFHAAGGVTNGASLGVIGEAGREAVIPLERPDTMRLLGDAIAASMPRQAFALATPAFAAAGGGGVVHHHHGDNIVQGAPGATGFDAVDAAVKLARIGERRGMR